MTTKQTADNMSKTRTDASAAQRIACPKCGTPCPVYHDAKQAAYYQRHPNGRGAWCKMSSQEVE